MVNIEELNNMYFINAEPVPYKIKKGGIIYIYPISLKNAPMYDWAKQVLEIQKNETGNIEAIQMSYLDFVVQYVIPNNEEYGQQLANLLRLCFDIQENKIGVQTNNNKTHLLIYDDNDMVKYAINHKEFNDIKTIILNQNNANYDDRYINPDVRELMEEYYQTKYANTVYPSLEKKKAFVSSKTGKSFKELNDFTYREFELIYNACVDSEIYMATKVTEASYKYEVKEQTSHPLFTKKKDPYADLFEETSVLNNKGINGVEQLNMITLD